MTNMMNDIIESFELEKEISGFENVSSCWVNDLIVTTDFCGEPQYLISSSSDHKIRGVSLKTDSSSVEFVYFLGENIEVERMMFIEKLQKILAIDTGTFLRVIDISVSEEGKVSLITSLRVRIGEKGNIFKKFLFIPFSNKTELVTSCRRGSCKGELKCIQFKDEEYTEASVSLKLKMREGIRGICFSKKDPNVLYLTGGDYGGRERTLKRFNYRENKIEKELLVKENTEVYLVSVITKQIQKGGHEYIFCGNGNRELFVLKNEIFVKKIKLNQTICSFIQFNSTHVLFLGHRGDIFLLGILFDDCNTNGEVFQEKKLTSSNDHLLGAFNPRIVFYRNRIYGGSKLNKICIYKVMNFENDDNEEEEKDLMERIDFLSNHMIHRELENAMKVENKIGLSLKLSELNVLFIFKTLLM